HYFDNNYDRGVAWYRAHFPVAVRGGSPQAGPIRIFGEASPYYLFHPRAAARARETVPAARLIVLLRDPVARAISHYQHSVRKGFETLSFPDAIERELAQISAEEAALAT